MAVKAFTLSNARRFYSSMGNSMAVKGLTPLKHFFKVNVSNANMAKSQ